nr:PIG-L family deacetylase [Streptomyces sp. SID13031]
MVVAAHPDDVDFGAAGTIALWTKAGIEVTYCILTDGQAGGFESDRDRAAVMSHASQHADPETLTTRLQRLFAQNATKAGLPENHYAEAFTVIRLGG